MQYEWPGNVRELENCIERAVALGNHAVLDVSDLPPAIRSAPPSPGAVDAEEAALPEARMAPASSDLEEMERATIQRVFEEVKGDKVLAGKRLGISRATLYRKLKRYGIQGQGSEDANNPN